MRRFVLSRKAILCFGLQRDCAAKAFESPVSSVFGIPQFRLSHSSGADASASSSESVGVCPETSALERLKKDTEESKPRPDPAAFDSILDVVSAIVDVRADYEGEINRALQHYAAKTARSMARGGPSSANGSAAAVVLNDRMASHKRLIKTVDQRYLSLCVQRANELFEMAVTYPEKNLLAEDMASAGLLTATLMALDEAVRFVDKPADFPDKYNRTTGKVKRAFSPWLSPSACEFIGSWMALRWDPRYIGALPTEEVQRRLALCCDLFVGDADVLSVMSQRLCNKEAVAKSANPAASAVTSLNAVTLAAKRLSVKVGDLSPLLAVVSFSKSMTSQQSLQVLSALCRVYESRDLEVVSVITRRETSNVSSYSLSDCLFALRACMSLSNISHPFVTEVIRALVPLSTQMKPRDVANVCHLLTMMRNSRRHSHVIRATCARDVRRLMPALLAQTKVHLKKYSPKDANYVLDCFLAFHVQHPYTFAQLTYGVAE